MRVLALPLALLAAAQDARAWGEQGHRMVGDIASRYLTPEASRLVAVLLLYDRLADGQQSHRATLGEVAYWADEIKDYPWGKVRGSWHFDDVPVCGEPDRSRYCKGGNCASAQLERHIDILKNDRATFRHRNEALKWVVHLVGDIHQPLHAANRHDRGGNLVQVSFFGQRDNPPYGTINLHTIWDIHLLQRLVAQKGAGAIASAPISASDKQNWERGSIADWVGESHDLARTVAYSLLAQESSCGGKIRDVLTIDEAYYDKAAPVVEEQLRKAGVRLARILNDAFARANRQAR